MRLFIKTTLLMVFFINMALAASPSIQIEVDRTQISLNETAQIIFTYDGEPTDLTPDFSPLEKDFNLLGSSQSTQASFINGKVSNRMQWIVTVAPNRTGELDIPTINFGKAKSMPRKIQVLSEKESRKSTKNRPAYLETTLSTRNPFVQSQLIYTIRLYYRVSIINGSITEPKIDDAIVMRIGKDKKYQKRQNGNLYQVLERKYAIFPQKSGPITIHPLNFSGLQSSDKISHGFDSFFIGSRGHPLHLRTETMTLNVQAIPKGAQNAEWLPTKKLTVEQNWPGFTNEIKVGEPITREIIISAEGITAAQIPEIKIPNTEGFNVYPDQARTENKIENDSIIGIRQQKIAYIPTKSGQLTLPALRIQWWDTKKNKLMTSTMEEKHLAVQSVPGTAPNQKMNAVIPIKTDDALQEPKSKVNEEQKRHDHLINNKWFIIALIFMGLWLITLLLWLRKSFFRKNSSTHSENLQHKKSIKYARKQLRAACKVNHAHDGQQYLLQWASLQWPEQAIHTLADLRKFSDDQALNGAIRQLEKTLYGNSEHTWDGMHLWSALEKFLKQSTKQKIRKMSSALPPLYLRE